MDGRPWEPAGAGAAARHDAFRGVHDGGGVVVPAVQRPAAPTHRAAAERRRAGE